MVFNSKGKIVSSLISSVETTLLFTVSQAQLVALPNGG